MKRLLLGLLFLFALASCGKTPTLTVKDTINIRVNEELKLEVELKHGEHEIIFESLDDSIVTVSKDGTIKGIKEGETKIVVSLKDTKIKKEVIVKVTKSTSDVTLSITVDDSIPLGSEKKVIVTISDGDVTYKSSDESIFTVDELGVINALKVGTATLTVTSVKDPSVKVEKDISITDGIYISASDLTVAKGLEVELIYETNDPLGIDVKILDEEALKITNNMIKGLLEGVHKIELVSRTNPAIKKEINVTVSNQYVNILDDNVDITVGDNFELEYDASSDVLIEIEDTNIVSVDAGIFKALKEGTTNIKISLQDYPEIYKTASITVFPMIEFVYEEDIILKLNEEKTLTISSDITFKLESSNEAIFTVVDQTLKGIKGGKAELIFTTDKNPQFEYRKEVTVLGMPTRMVLKANNELVLSETTQIEITFTPTGTYSDVVYEVANESVVKVDENGLVTAVGLGKTQVKVISTIDARLNASITFTVEQINAVKQDATEGETVLANGYTFTEGVNLFRTLDEALADDPKEVILVGTYESPIVFDKEATLTGTPTTYIKSTFTISSNQSIIRGFNFTEGGRLIVADNVSGVVVMNNKFSNITHTEPFIYAHKASDLEISYNEINASNKRAIVVENPLSNKITIKGNIIDDALNAISVTATEAYEASLSVFVIWNTITGGNEAVTVMLDYIAEFTHATSYVRFNKITESAIMAKAGSKNNVDFNLNYFGGVPDMTKFINLTEEDVDGYYLDPSKIIDEKDYNPNGPAYVEILNDFTEININEVVQIEVKILPKEMTTSSIQLLTGDPNLMLVSGMNIRFLRSGIVTLTVRSRLTEAVKDTLTFEILTDPGIELMPESVDNNLTAGKQLQFNTMVFPSRIADKGVQFSVDNTNIATIDQTGLLTAVAPGVVVVKAELHDDENVFQTFTLEIYNAFDDNRIMDFLAQSINTYAREREFLTYGATNIMYRGYESVSKIIFEELVRNKSMMIPDCDTLTDPAQRNNCEKLRPGARPEMLEGLEVYNNKRVHYVVVHETANTNPNQGAHSHAVYLINQVMGTTSLRQASWHFTIDDKELYQHIETDEMAWHAGDGTRKAGTTWSDTWGNQNIGGGNAHGIGIETSVARTDDILRIWQRTAKLSSQLAKEYNLPQENIKFHQHFSSKWCPQSMLRANLTWVFGEMVAYEYKLIHDFDGANIEFTSHNPEYVDNAGRVIKLPDRAITVSYTIKVTYNGETMEKTFYTYIPGTVH